jgi:hypothetical protein
MMMAANPLPIAAFQAAVASWQREPRAVPWAELGRPFGPHEARPRKEKRTAIPARPAAKRSQAWRQPASANQLAGERRQAPKARPVIAQGVALGLRTAKKVAPCKGALTDAPSAALQAAESFWQRQPRATPWAITERPFGPQEARPRRETRTAIPAQPTASYGPARRWLARSHQLAELRCQAPTARPSSAQGGALGHHNATRIEPCRGAIPRQRDVATTPFGPQEARPCNETRTAMARTAHRRAWPSADADHRGAPARRVRRSAEGAPLPSPGRRLGLRRREGCAL